MVNDAAFKEAVRNTAIFLVTIVPIQFILALIMALLVTAGLRGSGFWVYVYSIPIAVSDLAAGFIWLSIFTEHGYLNTVLTGLGLLDKPFIFLAYGISWPYIAVILAEVWRATSIVFVILVAGLQSIPKEYDEAAALACDPAYAAPQHSGCPHLAHHPGHPGVLCGDGPDRRRYQGAIFRGVSMVQ
jgi:multiple sugar transport system permease protein